MRAASNLVPGACMARVLEDGYGEWRHCFEKETLQATVHVHIASYFLSELVSTIQFSTCRQLSLKKTLLKGTLDLNPRRRMLNFSLIVFLPLPN